MCKFLHERYSASTTFIEATLHLALTRMKNTGQSMYEYVAKSESCTAQHALLSAQVDEGLLVTIYTE